MATAQRLDATFAALADPTRRAIVARLASGEATVLELAEPFAISLPAISRHLKVLEHAGLIERGRDAQRRPCRLRVEGLQDVTSWVEHTRQAWQERFDRLDAWLEELQQQDETRQRVRSSRGAPRKEKRRGKGKRDDGSP